MTIYKFLQTQFALSNIAMRRLKVSTLADMNDPLEAMGAKRIGPLKKALRASRRKLDKSTGMLCFSKDWQDPVLWSHYADKHRGICLGFDIPDNVLLDVTYVNEPIVLALDPRSSEPRLSVSDETRLLLTKFSGWKYESEQRQLVTLGDTINESGLYFCPFSKDLVLTRIILGPRCELSIDGIRRLAANFYPLVEVMKSRIGRNQFRVVKHKRKSTNPRLATIASRTASSHGDLNQVELAD